MPWNSRIELTPGFCILWAWMLLALPLRLLLAAAAAACVHELCHLLAVGLTGGKVLGLKARAGGVVMETSPMEPRQEALCALAGPAGSFALTLLGRWLPLLAVCGFCHGCFNLLPVYPLDGGRAMGCMLELLCPGRGRQIQNGAEWVVLLLLLGLAVRLRMGIGPLLVWASLVMRKIPCKDVHLGVQ